MIDERDLIKKIAEANRVFTPSAAISRSEIFAGRKTEILTVASAVMRPGQHAILFGERGVGKTSLSNVLDDYLPDNITTCSIRTNAVKGQTFTELWREILRHVHLSLVAKKELLPTIDEIEAAILLQIDDQTREITPSDVHFVMSQMPRPVSTIIIIDEYDRIASEEMACRMADTIKLLSDYSLDVTLVLVGVSDSVEALVYAHPSLSRALVQIHLPRMSTSELANIVDKGVAVLGIRMEDEVKRSIVTISQGLPHYTHLLALESITVALNAGRTYVEEIDLFDAVEKAMAKAEATIASSYMSAIARSSIHPLILAGCAYAERDIRGFFTPAAVGRALSSLTKDAQYEKNMSRFTPNLKEFSTEKRGRILTQHGTARAYQYRFTDPMMPPYVVLNTPSLLKEFTATSA